VDDYVWQPSRVSEGVRTPSGWSLDSNGSHLLATVGPEKFRVTEPVVAVPVVAPWASSYEQLSSSTNGSLPSVHSFPVSQYNVTPKSRLTEKFRRVHDIPATARDIEREPLFFLMTLCLRYHLRKRDFRKKRAWTPATRVILSEGEKSVLNGASFFQWNWKLAGYSFP